MQRVQTNNHWHNLSYRNEVPQSVLDSDFDYQDEDEAYDGFFKYRGNWYHLDGFMRHSDPSWPLSDWHGYAGDSFFSGVVIRISDDGEQYQVGTYLS